MRCGQCGKANPSDARFCAYCGTQVAVACPVCGETTRVGATTCSRCGAEFHAETPPAEASVRLSPEQARQLSRYMPRHLIEKVLSSRDTIIGERKQATFMFADVVGSTKLGEAFNEEEFRKLMDGALQRMIRVVHRYEGTVGQLRGDEVFALFGVPLVHEDDPERAVRAAYEIQQSIREYSQSLSRTHDIEQFDIRVTLNTGDVIVGEMGNDLHAEYTAMGDAVNTAAKLQGVAKPGTIVMTDETYQLVRHCIEADALGEVQLKGKHALMPVYELTDVRAAGRKLRGLEGLKAPLVGRSGELALLQEGFQKLSRGHGQIALVLGQAGIGKTRLISEFRSFVPTKEVLWLEGGCLSFGRSHSYHPLVAAMRKWLEDAAGSEIVDGGEALHQLVEEYLSGDERSAETEGFLAEMMGLDHGTGDVRKPDPEKVREGIQDAFRRILVRAASRSPVVLYLEDFHWADGASIELVRNVSECIRDVPLLLLLASRPDRESPIWNVKHGLTSEAADDLIQIELAPLSPSDSTHLVTQLLRLDDLPPALRVGVLERAEGNPLFLEELLRSLIDKGLIAEGEEGWVVEETDVETGLPRLLQGIISDRIDGLDEQTKQVLRAASVLGREFTVSFLTRMLEGEGFQVDLAVDDLFLAELVERVAEASMEYEFKHELIREVAYRSMLADTRTAYHRLAGTALEDLYEEANEEHSATLAHHFLEAGAWPRAAKYSLLAARRAQRLYANEEAIELYSAALHTAPKLEELAQQRVSYESLVGRAGVYARIGHAEDEAADLRTLRGLCEGADLCERLAEVTLLASDHACRTGQFDEALREATHGEDLYARIGDSKGRGRALQGIGTALSHMGDYAAAQRSFEAALKAIEGIGIPSLEAGIRKDLGTTHARLGRLDEAVQQYTEALALFRDVKDRSGAGAILANLAGLHYLQSDFENAASSFFDAQALFHELGNPRNRAKCLNNLGICHAALGDYAKARGFHEEAHQLYTAIGDEASKANALSNLGITQEALAVGGDPAFVLEPVGPLELVNAAEESHRSAQAIYAEAGDRIGLQRSEFNLGCVLMSKGDAEGAQRHLSQALEQARSLEQPELIARSLAALGRVHLFMHRRVEALDTTAQAVSMLEETGSSAEEEIRFSHARALRAVGRETEAEAERAAAIKELQAKAARIREKTTREQFLSAFAGLLDD